MKAVVIGATGHAGSYLVPKLVDMGYDVYAISRGNKKSYTSNLKQWEKVKYIVSNRAKMAAQGGFGEIICDLRPDLICDLISYELHEIIDLCEPIIADVAFREKTRIIQIGTIWIYGDKYLVPVTEDHERNAYYPYGIKKAQIENYLFKNTRQGKLKATVIHPGHICGKGWVPINPQGNFNPQVFEDIIRGNEIILPNDGKNTLHHVHSHDLASLIVACIANPEKSVGEAFHSVAKQAITMQGYAELLYAAFGKEAKIKYLPFDEFRLKVKEEDAQVSLEHIKHSPVCSMEKAEKMLGFFPQYSIIETVLDALDRKAEEILSKA